MQFEVTMRDGTTHQVEASYLELVQGPSSTSYTMLGPVPGYATAIVAAFPADLVHAIMPVSRKAYALRRSTTRVERGQVTDEPEPSETVPVLDDFD